jgi:hypothetical protein
MKKAILPLLQDRLRGGERIRPVITMHHVIGLVLITGMAIFLLWMCIVTFAPTWLGKNQTVDDRFTDVLGMAITAMWMFVLLPMAWGSLFLSAVAFGPDCFQYWDWRGRSHTVPYGSLTTVIWRRLPNSPSRFYLRIVYNVPGNDRPSRRLTIFTDVSKKQPLAEPVRDELICRCRQIGRAHV